MSEQTSLKDLILDPHLSDAPADPTTPQRKASTPDRHVWVRASAGSGKTKVLIDRLLRLLLPDPVTNAPGVAPDKILCLTFTKAGAAEMALRLQKKLLDWSALDEEKLKTELASLIGGNVTENLLKESRRLLARLLDAPSRLRILTIHSFCQSVLGRFPVETGLSPDFKVIEEGEAADYIRKALTDILASPVRDPDLNAVFTRLSITRNFDQLRAELKKLMQEPIKLRDLAGPSPSLKALTDRLAAAFGIDIDQSSEAAACREDNIPRHSIETIANALKNSGDKRDAVKSDIILNWLSASEAERLATLGRYKKIIESNPYGKHAKADQDYQDRKIKEIERLDRCRLVRNILATADLVYLGLHILKAYENHKRFMGVLDYNDLIFTTRRLLSGDFQREEGSNRFSTAWVLYKLDEGIDHILVDESQDTNPDQWKIIELLSEEFFAGQTRHFDRPRSLFVVGDEKQSIFSFQRADPAEFHRMKDYFAAKVETLGQQGFEESLIFSFRSTAPVLKLVDAVFEDAGLRGHIGLGLTDRLRHISFRSDRNGERHGTVELWPIVVEEKKSAVHSGWTLPLDTGNAKPSAQQRLAKQIAGHINFMVQKGEAKPGDFLILMRTRSPLMLHIIRELKNASLPVSGLDRMVLSESLIVQDLLAACDFAILPENDFALACLLKSPFIGLDDHDLMTLCIGRPKTQSLFETLRDHKDYQAVSRWLQRLTAFARQVQPYEFLDDLLTGPCPADPEGSGYRACQMRLGVDTLEPLDEILGQALKIELQDIRTLQDFVAYQRGQTREIKREMEEESDQVRIMTVHASKGLEAPIVILPDTTNVPSSGRIDTFLWPDKSGLSAPLWAESKAYRSNIYDQGHGRAYALQIEEHSRLLYVALTRAREHLIVCGAAKKETAPAQSWYSAVEAGFEKLPDTVTQDNGTRLYKVAKEKSEHHAPGVRENVSLPAWIRNNAPQEKEAFSVLTPSQQGVDESESVYSPLDQAREGRFRRGLATHKLLQILPDLNPAKREEAARRYLARPALGLSPDLQESIVTETMNVIHDPVFAPVFAPGSLAEVPVTGEISPGQLINGQIDRLVITDTDILIVDFKTNRPSPRETGAVPPLYKAQLKAYATALSLIYPDRKVKCALLWTDQPLLMPVSIDVNI